MDSDKLYRSITRSGIHDAEIQISSLESFTKMTMIDNKMPKRIQLSMEKSFVIKCIRNKKMMTIITSDESRIEKSIEEAYRLANELGTQDTQTHFYSGRHKRLKQIEKYKNKQQKIEEIVNYIKNIKDRYIHTINAIIDENSYVFSSANSNGLRVDLKSKLNDFEFDIIAKDGDDQATFGEDGEFIDNFDYERVINETLSIAKSMLNAKPAPTFSGKLLLDERAMIDLLMSLFPAFNGENIVKKMSFLYGYLNKPIGGENLNIYEIPSIKGSFYNRKFDDEMVPTRKKNIIEKGILRNYFNSIYSAEKLGFEPGGNNFQLTMDGIRPTNLIFESGTSGYEEMIKEIDRGVIMIRTGDSPNIVSGDISAMVSTGYYVENGEIKYPVKETMIGGNLIKMFKGIVMISKSQMTRYGITAPKLLINNVKISGKN